VKPKLTCNGLKFGSQLEEDADSDYDQKTPERITKLAGGVAVRLKVGGD